MRVFLIAGEPSGDLLGAALMEGLKALVPDVTFDGIGGPQMIGQGLTSRFEMSELTVMGLTEVLPKYLHLKRRIRETAEAVIHTKPDVLITIDSPDFCLRVAKQVKAARAQRIVHYVAPSVWAWRPKRAQKMVGRVDQVLALLPFEPPFLEAVGIPCDFVGHPVAALPPPDPEQVTSFRQSHGLSKADPLLLVLPGSRKGEVARLGPPFTETVKRFALKHPNLRSMVIVSGNVAAQVDDLLQDWPDAPLMITGDDPKAKMVAMAAADLALATSGTVALELAAAGTPMVIGYKLAPISEMIVKRMIITKRVNLVNIVTDSDHVPELVSNACTPEALIAALEQVQIAPDAQRAVLAQTMQALGQGGEAPGLRAARAVLARMP